VNTGRPLQVKHWGVATPAALTPMDLKLVIPTNRNCSRENGPTIHICYSVRPLVVYSAQDHKRIIRPHRKTAKPRHVVLDGVPYPYSDGEGQLGQFAACKM